MERARCRSCGASIFWVVMVPSGKRMPLNAVPASNGNVVVGEDGRAFVDTGPGRAKFLSHFATCPNSNKHRRSR